MELRPVQLSLTLRAVGDEPEPQELWESLPDEARARLLSLFAARDCPKCHCRGRGGVTSERSVTPNRGAVASRRDRVHPAIEPRGRWRGTSRAVSCSTSSGAGGGARVAREPVDRDR